VQNPATCTARLSDHRPGLRLLAPTPRGGGSPGHSPVLGLQDSGRLLHTLCMVARSAAMRTQCSRLSVLRRGGRRGSRRNGALLFHCVCSGRQRGAYLYSSDLVRRAQSVSTSLGRGAPRCLDMCCPRCCTVPGRITGVLPGARNNANEGRSIEVKHPPVGSWGGIARRLLFRNSPRVSPEIWQAEGANSNKPQSDPCACG
jgi:hypothetical protein